MNIEENKLIMAFMGVEPKGDDKTGYYWRDGVFFHMSAPTKEEAIQRIAQYISYESDYILIMEVIDKIESLNYSTSILFEKGEYHVIISSDTDEDFHVYAFSPESKIKAIYYAINDFLKLINAPQNGK